MTKIKMVLGGFLHPGQLLILFMILLSAFAVVFNSYQSRQLFHQLQTLQKEVGSLQGEWHQLLVEEGAFSTQMLIEQKAIEQLGMKIPFNEDTIAINLK